MSMPDDEELLRPGTPFVPDEGEVKAENKQLPCGWCYGPGPCLCPQHRTPEEWREAVTEAIREEFPSAKNVPVSPRTIQANEAIYTAADMDRALRAAKEEQIATVKAAVEEERKRAVTFMDAMVATAAEQLPPEGSDNFEARVMDKYPFPCPIKDCRARVREQNATCAIHGALPPTPETILQEAQRIVHGDRNKAYGSPDRNHGLTAELFNVYLGGRSQREDDPPNDQHRYGEGSRLDSHDVCVFNMLQKISRTAHQLRTTGRPHRDSLVDIAGYAANMDMIDKEREGNHGA